MLDAALLPSGGNGTRLKDFPTPRAHEAANFPNVTIGQLSKLNHEDKSPLVLCSAFVYVLKEADAANPSIFGNFCAYGSGIPYQMSHSLTSKGKLTLHRASEG